MFGLSPDIWRPIILTLELASLTTAILLVVATPIAWWLARSRSWWAEIVASVVALPLVLPPTVLGFYLLVAMGSGSSLGAWYERLSGHPLVFSFEGLLVASLIFNIPFALMPMQRAFEAIPAELFDAARTCGLSRWRTLWRVELPLAWRGILSAMIMTAAHTLGEFGVVLMVGGNIPGETRTIAIAIYDKVQSFELQAAGVMSATLLAVSLATLVATAWLTRTRAHGGAQPRRAG